VLNTLPLILPNAKSVFYIKQFIHNNHQIDSYIAFYILMTTGYILVCSWPQFAQL